MAIDQELLSEALGASSRVGELEDELEGAKAEYRSAVRRLHLAGASMREVAEALGISHQRVHQIIEEGGVRRWRRRRQTDAAVTRAACSFCDREQRQVRKLIAGPGVYICDPCILAAVGVATSGRPAASPALTTVPPDAVVSCAFCHKPRESVRSIVARSDGADAQATICDECLGLCGEILSEQLRESPGS